MTHRDRWRCGESDEIDGWPTNLMTNLTMTNMLNDRPRLLNYADKEIYKSFTSGQKVTNLAFTF